MTTSTPTTTTNDGLKRGLLALLTMTGIAGGFLLVLGASEKKNSSTDLARSSNPVDVAAARAEALIRAVQQLPDGVSPYTFKRLRDAVEDLRTATTRRAAALRQVKKEHRALVQLVKSQWTSDELAGVDWSEVG